MKWGALFYYTLVLLLCCVIAQATSNTPRRLQLKKKISPKKSSPFSGILLCICHNYEQSWVRTVIINFNCQPDTTEELSVSGWSVLIISWYRKVQPTVGSTIPWAGDRELYKKSSWVRAFEWASKWHPSLFLPYLFGCEASSLVTGHTVWKSKQSYHQVPGFSSCLDVPPWWTVTWKCMPSKLSLSLKLLLVGVFYHRDRNKTSLADACHFG